MSTILSSRQKQSAITQLCSTYMVNQLVSLHSSRQKFIKYITDSNRGKVGEMLSREFVYLPNFEKTLVVLYSNLKHYRAKAKKGSPFFLEDICRNVWDNLNKLLPIGNRHTFSCETEKTEITGDPVIIYAGIFSLLCSLREMIMLGGNIHLTINPGAGYTFVEMKATAPEFTDKIKLDELCKALKSKKFSECDVRSSAILTSFFSQKNIKCKTQLVNNKRRSYTDDSQSFDSIFSVFLSFLK